MSKKLSKEARKAFLKEHQIDESKLNKGGYYPGMPGVWLNTHGERRLWDIALNEEGEVASRMDPRPHDIYKALLTLMDTHPMSRNMILQAAKSWTKGKRKAERRMKLRKFFKALQFWNRWKKTPPAPKPGTPERFKHKGREAIRIPINIKTENKA
jgi:hypothetical protein